MKKAKITIINRPPKLAWLLKMRFPEYSFEGGVACTFGKVVFSKDINMDESFRIHEETHLMQQRYSYIFAFFWWIVYFISAEFRYNQEVKAYGRQMRFIQEHYPRGVQMKWLYRLATQLGSSLYGKNRNTCMTIRVNNILIVARNLKDK